MKVKFKNWAELGHCIAMLGNDLPLGVMETKQLGHIQRVIIKIDLIPEADNENILEGRRPDAVRSGD